MLLIFVRGVLLPLYQSLFEPVKSNAAERRERKSGEKIAQIALYPVYVI